MSCTVNKQVKLEMYYSVGPPTTHAILMLISAKRVHFKYK